MSLLKQNFLKSTFLVMTAIVLLRSLGFIREMALAAVYGAGMKTDAFVVASTSPQVLLAFIGSAVAAVYIPMYQRHRERKDLFTSNIINLLVVLGLAFSVAFTVFPESLVFVFASQLDAQTFELAAVLTRIMAWATIPILLMSIYRSYLEVHGAFFTAHITYAAVNICIITSVFFSVSTGYLPLLGIGAVVGNVLCVVALIVSARRHGLGYRPYLNLRDSSVREMLVLAAPVILATGISEINQIVDRNFASSLASGAISSLNYAARLVALAAAFMGSAVATVLFPKLSEFASDDNFASMKRYLMGCLKNLTPVLLPLTAGAVILAEPLVRILFERGAFTAHDTQRTAECLQMYAACIFCSSISTVLLRACHAMKDMKGPAVCSSVAIAVNIALNFLLVGPLRHVGIALSTSAAAVVTMVSLALVLRRKLGPLGMRGEIPEFAKALAATLVMSGGVWAGVRFLPVMSGDIAQCVGLTVGLVLAGAALYFALHAAMRSAFAKDAWMLVRSALASGQR